MDLFLILKINLFIFYVNVILKQKLKFTEKLRKKAARVKIRYTWRMVIKLLNFFLYLFIYWDVWQFLLLLSYIVFITNLTL